MTPLVLGAVLCGLPGQPGPAAEVGRPRLVVQTGHSGFGVSYISLSPDGARLLTASNRVAVLWDVKTGREVRRFEGHRGWVDGATFAPDGATVLTCGTDKTVRLWNMSTGKELARWSADEAVRRAFFSPDGRTVLTCGDEHGARLWDPTTGKEVRRFVGHQGGTWSVAFSPDGKRVLTAGDDKTARLWDAATGKELARFVGHTEEVFAVALSPDGTRVLTGSRDTTARLWDAATGKELFRLKTLKGHTFEVNAVAFTPDGTHALTGSLDRTLRVWDAATGKPVRAFEGLPGRAVAFTPDTRLALMSDGKGGAYFWDTAAGAVGQRFAGVPGEIFSAAFSPDGERVLLGNVEKVAYLWSLRQGREVQRFVGHENYIAAVALSPDGRHALTGSWDKTARLWDVATGKELRRFKGHTNIVLAVAFSPDGKRVLTGSRDKTARLWDLDGNELRLFQGVITDRDNGASAVSFSPDGKRVRITWPASTAVFDADTGKPLLRFPGGGHLTPDEKRLLSGGASLCVWDTRANKVVHSLATVGKDPRYGAQTTLKGTLSPDGKTVAAITDSLSVQLWSAETGAKGPRLEGHTQPLNVAAVSPDGELALTGGYDGVAKLWNARTGAELCGLVSLREKGWAVVAPDGRFDTGDPDALHGLHWVVPDDPLRPLAPEVFMRDYYEPELLPRVLAGARFKPVRALAELNRVQPVVKVVGAVPRADAPDTADVTVEVAGAARALPRPGGPALVRSGAFDLHLFRDGQLVGVHPGDRGAVRLDPKTGRATVTFERVKLPRVAGARAVEFSAYAFNADRVKSDTARLRYDLPPFAARKGTAFVVCVGVNGSDEPKWDLRCAVPDARVMASTLERALAANGRYEKVVVVRLLSEPAFDKAGKRTGTDSTATKANLREVLAALAGRGATDRLLTAVPAAKGLREARPEDALFLTFSTHGYNGPDGRFYLFPSDIGRGAGRTVTPELLARAVSSDELSEWLRAVDAGEMVAVIDACHSAGSVAADGFKPGPMGNRGLGQLAYNKRMRILAASQADDVALEDDRIGHGLLTYALCKDGLGKGRADFEPADGTILLGEWLRFGVKRVPEVVDEIATGGPIGADGKTRAVSATGRALVPVGGKQQVAQLPSLFDFTRGADTLPLAQKPK